MANIVYTRNLFLRGLCVIYLFAFISFYFQIPGLYGNNGVLPARTHLQASREKTLSDTIKKKPTLLWFAPSLGLNTEYMMDVLSLTGVILSFFGFISQRFCNAMIFAVLWSLYLSLYHAGQTFMWFQWDVLLLEVGVLSIFIAPWKWDGNTKQKNKPLAQAPSDDMAFFLIRWLFFRFMFSSGVVKLQSGCPTWWGLTALNVHFESQPLPTMLAWYLHHLPTWFLKLGTVFTHIVEQIMPFLFFFPLRSVRYVGFFFQVFLQVSIILSGNYNFFNFLTIVIGLSLLDDNFFFKEKEKNSTFSNKFLNIAVNFLIHGFVLYIAVVYFGVRVTPNWTIESEITFTKAEFDQFLKRAVPAGSYLACLTLFVLTFKAIYKSITAPQGKFFNTVVTLFYAMFVLFLFGVSLVPYSGLHKSTNITSVLPMRRIYSQLEHLQIANSYGLFRRMTGVGGRPEVVIEGSNNFEGPWTEYHFKYKPGDVNSSMPLVAPYQPRLDWQMWFAALGTYHQNPWLMSVAYRILEGEKTVLQLLDSKRLPFSTPPKYLKASLYHYHYTPWSKRTSPTWWKRELVGEYFPIFTKTHSPLIDYLKTVKILDSQEAINADYKSVTPWMKAILDAIRNSVGKLDPVIFIWSVFSAGCAIISTKATFSGSSNNREKS